MLEIYPIGKAQFPTEFGPDFVRESIETIAQLPSELKSAVDGCRDLDQHIREGTWSIRALVHHIADSHMNAYIRTKLALTEDAPTVRPYDEVAWSRLADSRMDVGVALDLVSALHLRWVELVSSLGDAEFQRPWQMPGGEPRALWRLPVLYAWHGRHHVAQIHQAREHFKV